ncbi:11765_t:CDS:2 [Ambispora leptoticha]|uniref:11765_t:CDS:1 n=1 Tax=Ambispora leptoticha TaxID=144679 RepID=A0A9N8ZI56_9GLOM|nr:11765_t:CDS:2 [Ambispora leptoticha]
MPPPRSRFKEVITKEKSSQGRMSASASKPTNTNIINTNTRAHTPIATTTTSSNKKSGMTAMAIKENPLLRGSSKPTVTSKTTAASNKKQQPTSPHRPTTPSGKNFIERNIQLAGSKTPPPPPLSPTRVSRTPSPDSCSSPIRKTEASTAAVGTKLAVGTMKDSSKKKSAISPNATSCAATNRSSNNSATTPSSPLESALLQENKKLKMFLNERSQELHDAEVEIQECEEIILALQERVRQVEARNRELQIENETLRDKVIEQESQKSSTSILSAIMNNTQRIRGEPLNEENNVKVAPAPISTPQQSVLSTLIAPIAKVNPLTPAPVSVHDSFQQSAPSQIESKALVQPPSSAASFVDQPRIQPSKMESPLKPEMFDTPMILDRQALNKAKATAAALNTVMEETDDSDDEFSVDGDKNEYNRDVFSDKGIHSSVSSFEEDNYEDNEKAHVISNVMTNSARNERFSLSEDIKIWKSNHSAKLNDLNVIMEEDEEEEEDEEDDEFELPPNLLNNPKQHLDQISSVAMSSSIDQPKAFFPAQKLKPIIQITHDKANSSDSPSFEITKQQLANNQQLLTDSDNSSEQSLNVDSHNIGGKSSFGNNPVVSNPKPVIPHHLADFQQSINGNEQSTQHNNKLALEKSSQDYFSCLHEATTVNPIHRESFSSVKSDESDMWSTPSASSSQHEYYSSSATSRSTTRTTQSTNSISAFGSSPQRSLHYNTNENENNPSHASLAASYTDNPLQQFNPTDEFYHYSQNRVAQNNSAYPQQQINSNLPSTTGLNSNDYSTSARSQSQQSFSSTSDIQSSVASSEYSITPTPVNDRPSSPKHLFNQSSAKNSPQLSNRRMVCPNDSSQLSTSHVHSRLLSPTSVSPSRPRNPTPLTAATSSPSSTSSSSTGLANSTDNTSQTSATSISSAVPSSALSNSTTSQNCTPALNSVRSAPLSQDETQSADHAFSPPTPPETNDSMAVFKHYLRLLSETCSRNSPLNYYELQKYIDEGSSAKVYSATSLKTREELAIKVVPLTYSLEFIFNEIYVLKNLKHKNVVGFKESFLRWDGKTREIWTVMEKCARGDVTSRAGNISQKEVARIARDILNGLKHVHEAGIIHRDIKLENILMAANNDVKIADFGVCSLTPTSTTGMVGTIPYMAPDVVNVNENNPYSTKADIWSLGICVLELLTGKAAWGRLSDTEIFAMLKRGEKPPTFGRLRKKADIGWEAVDFLERCFAKNSENRCSAEELLQHPFITSLLA